MTGMKQGRELQAWFVERADGFAGEADPFISLEYRSKIAAVSPGDKAVALSNGRGNVCNFVTG